MRTEQLSSVGSTASEALLESFLGLAEQMDWDLRRTLLPRRSGLVHLLDKSQQEGLRPSFLVDPEDGGFEFQDDREAEDYTMIEKD